MNKPQTFLSVYNKITQKGFWAVRSNNKLFAFGGICKAGDFRKKEVDKYADVSGSL